MRKSRCGECCRGWICFRVFLFSCRDDIVCDVEKVLRLDEHEDMMLKQNQSLTDLESAVSTLLSDCCCRFTVLSQYHKF